MTDLIPVALDCETHPIGPWEIAPKMVCVSYALVFEDDSRATHLVGNSVVEYLEDILLARLTDVDYLSIFHNAAYDLTVMARSYPALIPHIFDALEAERVDDTIIRERLLHLSTHGSLNLLRLPGGGASKIEYSLAKLAEKYLGKDREASKTGPDSWRLSFDKLDGMRAVDYPADAAAYAKEDAEDTLNIWLAQEAIAAAGPGGTTTSRYQTACDFALRLMTCQGIRTDQEHVKKIAAQLDRELAPEQFPLLLESGILFPGSPPRPHARGAKHHVEGCTGVMPADHIGLVACKCPPKMTAGEPSSIKQAPLQILVAELCKEIGIEPKLTETDKIAIDADQIGQLVEHSEILQEYARRQEIARLQSTYIPALLGNARVWPNFSVLVETGRTSSYGSSRGRPALYPSLNIQNQPRTIHGMDIRGCFLPEEGCVFFDVDYTALELACVGQITKDLFGRSIHLELYNAGVDLHSYLAAQLVLRIGQDDLSKHFRSMKFRDAKHAHDQFRLCLKMDDPEIVEWAKHWRTFAKPVGLGFPGGLGATTMVSFARTTYDVTMTEDEARAAKQAWLDTYPEMVLYFQWVKEQRDPLNTRVWDEDDPEPQDAYWYTTRLGMVRRGATYCAVANGKAMQSPGAEGGKLATFYVQRECWDPTQNSVLYGCRPHAFIHDQIIGSTTEDESLWHDQCMRVSQVMIESMECVLPDVKVRTEPLLTRVWSKDAKPTFDASGRLVPWEPKT